MKYLIFLIFLGFGLLIGFLVGDYTRKVFIRKEARLAEIDRPYRINTRFYELMEN